MRLRNKLSNGKSTVLLLIWIQLSDGTLQVSEPSSSLLKISDSSSTDKISPRSSSFDKHQGSESTAKSTLKKWPSESNRRNSIGPGWFGFNHFVPRSARQLPLGYDRNALLGESTQLYPLMNIPSFSHMSFNPSMSLHHQLNEIQHNFLPRPNHGGFLESQLVVIHQPLHMPPGYLVPVYRPQHSAPKISPPVHDRNYQQHKVNLQPSSSAQNPVTIKIVPLKITSFDIGNVLKTMSWVPIPLDLLRAANRQKENLNDGRTYNNKPIFDDDDESDLPPPSSHVATPLGITYSDNLRSERYENRYNSREQTRFN